MNKIIITIAILFIQVNVFAQCIEGNGMIVDNSVTTSIIEYLKISAQVDLVEVSQGEAQSIVVSGDSNILDSLDVYTVGDSLVVEFPLDTCYIDYSLNINITTPSIQGVDFRGSGNIKINDFDTTPSLSIVNSGAGHIDIAEYTSATFFDVINDGSGSVSMLSDFPSLDKYLITNNGTGSYYGCQLSVDSCFVSIFGTGFASVRANEYLDVDIIGGGNVEYFGTPEIVFSNGFGTGELLEGTDAGCCSFFAEITGDSEFCEGESSVLTAEGGLSYAWSTGETTASIDATTTNHYTVTITDSRGCTNVKTINVVAHELPAVNFSLDQDTLCISESMVQLVGGTPLGGHYSGSGVSSNMFDAEAAGLGVHSLSYTFVDLNGCSSTSSAEITVNDCITNVASLNFDKSVEVYPNPSNGAFTIKLNDMLEDVEVQLIDVRGSIIKTDDLLDGQIVVNGIPKGVYFVRLLGDDFHLAKRIIVQ